MIHTNQLVENVPNKSSEKLMMLLCHFQVSVKNELQVQLERAKNLYEFICSKGEDIINLKYRNRSKVQVFFTYSLYQHCSQVFIFYFSLLLFLYIFSPQQFLIEPTN